MFVTGLNKSTCHAIRRSFNLWPGIKIHFDWSHSQYHFYLVNKSSYQPHQYDHELLARTYFSDLTSMNVKTSHTRSPDGMFWLCRLQHSFEGISVFYQHPFIFTVFMGDKSSTNAFLLQEPGGFSNWKKAEGHFSATEIVTSQAQAKKQMAKLSTYCCSSFKL